MTSLRKLALWIVLGITALPAGAADAPNKAAVASAHPLATEAGMEILAAGGNAFDAAVAVSAALSVVEGYSSGIGGGGFWLLHRAADGFEVMVDGREVAPAAATRDMYLDENGAAIERLSKDGVLAAGIPGVPAGLEHISRHYGELPLAESLAPAIRLARDGFPLDARMQRGLKFKRDLLARFRGSAEIFLLDGKVPPLGHIIRQPGLAMTLERIASEGADGFYRGPVAEALVRGVRSEGGMWSMEDLAGYAARERPPVVLDYQGVRIVAASLPSAGGVALANIFNILAGYRFADMDRVTRVHLLTEAMRRAYRDRAQYLGDPDFVAAPVAQLVHPFYAAGQRATIRLDRATPSATLPPAYRQSEAEDTSHFSVLDPAGNRVAGTQSINGWFGSGYVEPETGVMLNNEMDDFSVKPGEPNLFQLVGAEANEVAPGKRMLSSMTPTFLESDRGVAILGTPGGSRIISMVLLASLAWIDGADAAGMVALPRFHHQYLPDQLVHEKGALDAAEIDALKAMGHSLKESSRLYGNMQVVTWDRGTGEVHAASDPRGQGESRIY
jgi:gamma-glutamyltranspeptidase/glutathione hydrolase